MANFISPDAVKARGPGDHPVSLRHDAGALGLWSHRDNAFIDLDDPTAIPTGVTVWVELPFEELPPKVQEYVRLCSRIRYQTENGAGASYLKDLKDSAARLLREIQHEQTSTLRSNIGNRPAFQRKMTDIRTGGLFQQTRVPIR